MKSYQPGDTAYIIVNNREVSPVKILKQNGHMYVVRFESGSGIQVRESRLYATQIEAMDSLPERESKKKLWHSHYEAGL